MDKLRHDEDAQSRSLLENDGSEAPRVPPASSRAEGSLETIKLLFNGTGPSLPIAKATGLKIIKASDGKY